MELLNDVPITQFCQDRNYGLRSRLALFRQVCLAVHRAHQEGCIHRTLSPSTVLVVLDGENAVPVVIGFGIAPAPTGEINQPTSFTPSGEFLRPLVYMSPEQASGPRTRIDARTDLYSLGVLLYELLTDLPPFDPELLRAAGNKGMRRIIRRKTPPKPSTRLRDARSRSTAPGPTRFGAPLRNLPGELDAIVMQAIAKHRARRYQSAKEFATDLRLYLAGDPVQAARLHASTRLRTAALGMAATIALALTSLVAINRWETAWDTRILHESDRARMEAERAWNAKRAEQERSAPPRPRATAAPFVDGPLNREVGRGIETVTFKVPGGRPDEICVIPHHLPFANYRGKGGAKDRADERRLAGYDYYKAGAAESGVIGISPKRTSTSAAVNLYELPSGTTRPEQLTASYCRSLEQMGKRVAKFKQTDNKFTTTSTASILGYYHVSRALGDICEIKPAVLRTMDIQQHKQVVRLASQMGARGTVAKSWALFNNYYANPKRSSVAHDLFTSDYTQIYGALLENTTGEENYSEWLRAGTNLSGTQAFRNMADPRPVASILGSSAFSQRNVQALLAMRDMSELILLDYLLAQSDRLSGGNISAYRFAYDFHGGAVKSAKASKAAELPPGASRVIVKKLTIKDTDAGLLNSNVFERKGYLERIRHMHPRTYDCLQTFARMWEEDPEVKAFFHRECTFSTSQLARFGNYLQRAASTLRNRRENGALRLDLDLDDYYHRGESPSRSPEIAASVGRWERGAANRPEDVERVQHLLTAAAQILHLRELDPMGIDGRIASPPHHSNTVIAIEAFERACKLDVHGVIEPGSPTWHYLRGAAGEAPGQRGHVQASERYPLLAREAPSILIAPEVEQDKR